MIKHTKRPILVILCIIIMIVGYLAFFRISVPKNETLGNSLGNLLNKGLFAKEGDWIYYRNDGDGGKLYKFNINDKRNIKLTNVPISHISVIGDWVYYFKDDNNSSINIVSTNGKRNKTLFKDQVNNIIVSDRIYYLLKRNSPLDGIYSLNLNGRNRKYITGGDRVNEFSIDTESIYFASMSGSSNINNSNDSKIFLYQRPIDGKSNDNILGQISTMDSNLIVDDGWIYYTDGHGGNTNLYRAKIDAFEGIKLINRNVKRINISRNYIFYSVMEEIVDGRTKGKLYRSDLDGNNEVKLADNYLDSIHVLDGWIYYGLIDKASNQFNIIRLSIDGEEEETILLK